MIVEPITVWAALVGMFVGMFVGALVVLGEWQRARLRWLEAMQTRQDEVKAVAEELRREHNKLPQHNAPDMVAAIREGVTEQLKKRSASVS
jgi:cytochrome oxidase assembly protein ShyY1